MALRPLLSEEFAFITYRDMRFSMSVSIIVRAAGFLEPGLKII